MKDSSVFRSKGFMAVAVLALVLALAAVAVGCGSSSGGGSSASPSSSGAIKTGGVVKIGAQAGNGNFDPVLFAGAVGDIQLQAQIYEKLVTLGQDFSVQPALATKWSSPSGKVWTFTLQPNVKFSNGQPFTSADVVYSMGRLRSKKLGSPMAAIYANVKSVTAPDPTTVVFTLAKVDSEFPASLTDYRDLMLCKSVTDPAKDPVGTGPFMLKSISAEDRAILVKNPTYWGKDAQGNQLPYLDEVDYIYSPDVAGQVASLQGGALNYVPGLTASQKQTVEGSPSLKTITTQTNYCFELQIRCDVKPGSNLKFRQALLMGTDLPGITALVAPGLATPGNSTLVGPAYKTDYLNTVPKYDVAGAKQLLAQAGYPNGVTIKVVAQTAAPMPDLVTAWQAQMKQIGVTVNIQQVPPSVYYATKGTDNWYQAPFGTVDWGTRAAPVTYFQLALTSTAPWNYSRWKDPQFDSVVNQIVAELDVTKRGALYQQAQTILQQQVPMINFLEQTAVAGMSKNLDGIALAPDYPQTLMTTAHYTQ
jgi:peptide/nickel transport system substrate-binding protein